MNLLRHTVARAGAAVLLTAGVLTMTVAPALAAVPDVDLAVTLTGTTIAADAEGKFGRLTVANLGVGTPEQVLLRFDVTGLDESKVELDRDGDGLGKCELATHEILCGLGDDFVPGPAASVGLDVPLLRLDGATGAAGTLTVTVEVEGDAVADNDSVTATVSVGDRGVDLNVVAEDVYAIDDDGAVTGKPVVPGEVSVLIGHVLNQGDRTARGVTVAVKLPKGATFAEKLPACAYGTGNRTATCTYTDLDLIPADLDDTETFLLSGKDFHFSVEVAESAKAPVLKNGLFAATAIDSAEVDARSIAKSLNAAKKQPAMRTGNVRDLTVSAVRDVDDSDNSDEFAVLVAPEESGGSGGGGSLPVTGPQAAVLGGGGLAVGVAGALLFLSARRRRVVLVTPGDERAPTDRRSFI